jgi:hypothetical protein
LKRVLPAAGKAATAGVFQTAGDLASLAGEAPGRGAAVAATVAAMTTVHIYQPSKTAMQSGRAGTRKWLLEFEREAPKVTDPLMGWVGSADTLRQVRLTFASREAALAFAEENGYNAVVHEPRVRKVRPKSYADNFAFRQVE